MMNARKVVCRLVLVSVVVVGINACIPAQQFGVAADAGDVLQASAEPAEALPLPYAQALVSVNDGKAGRMFLGQRQGDSEYWIASNGLGFWMRDARIVASVGLRDKLKSLHALSRTASPVALVQGDEREVRATFYAELATDELGRIVVSDMTVAKDAQLVSVDGRLRKLVPVTERMRIPDTGEEWKNEYWVDPDSQRVLVSRQRLPAVDYEVRFEVLR